MFHILREGGAEVFHAWEGGVEMFHILGEGGAEVFHAWEDGVEVFHILGEGGVEVLRCFTYLGTVVLRWEWNVLSQVGSDPEV